MDRMTIRNSDGSVSQPTDMNWSEVLERLAAYEDTGLTPEHIMAMVNPPPCIYCEIPPEEIDAAYDALSKGNPGPIMHPASLEPKIEFMFAWIRTTEMLPPVGEPVLIARKIRHNDTVLVEPAVLRPDGTWKAIGHKIKPSSVHHWMPMPEPPKEGNVDV